MLVVRLRQLGLLDEDSSCLNHIFCHPFHTRIWTIQEVAQSRNCYITCGKSTLPWDIYSAAAEFLLYNQLIEEIDMQGVRNYISIDIRNILRARILDSSPFASPDEDQKDHEMSILTSCLSQVRTLQATKPEDKIFGLYSIYTALGVPIPAPDYTKSLAQVYQEATAAIVIYYRSLHVLCYTDGNWHNPGLPSWVPDWQNEGFELATRQSDATEGSQIASTVLQMLVPAPGRLRVRGKLIGTMTTRSRGDFRAQRWGTSNTFDHLPILRQGKYDFTNEIEALRGHINRIQILREWKSEIQRTMPTHSEIDHQKTLLYLLQQNNTSSDLQNETISFFLDILNYPDTTHNLTEGELVASRWKQADSNSSGWNTEVTHCAILAASLLPSPQSLSQDIRKLNPNPVPESMRASCLDLIVDWAGSTGGRALVTLHASGNTLNATNILGTAYHAVEVGDVAALLEGAEWPVVLRQTTRDLWRYGGTAVVMGIMGGEAWKGEDGVVDGLRDFVLV